jgi:hypothetical protein
LAISVAALSGPRFPLLSMGGGCHA